MTYIAPSTTSATSKLTRAMIVFALGAIVAFSNTHSANAHPTFSCKKTYNITERTICKSWKLSYLDRKMSRSYYKLRQRLSKHNRRVLRYEQRNWLKDQRNWCGDSKACIADQYKDRIKDLRNWYV